MSQVIRFHPRPRRLSGGVIRAGLDRLPGAALTVTPGGGLYPNKPGSFTNTREIDFSQNVPGSVGSDRAITGASGWSMIYDQDYGGGAYSVMKVADATAPHGDGSVWRWHFRPGTFGASYGVGNVYTNLTSQGISHLYTAMTIKWDASYPWHSVSNKCLWWTAGQVLMQSKEGSGSGARWLHGESLGSSQWLDSVAGPLNGAVLVTYLNTPVALGIWHHIEVLIDRPGKTMKIWDNGTLELHATNVNYSAATEQEFQHTAYRGGGGETLATDGYYWVDHLHLAWG